ncbi:cytochrome P450 [Neolentinus lepideus HHB14362 ss-1]|uniref:Cytochrome P450 n=1 Tax=Neolentinus lepideus HHB14362 ss-1 TaxID=1314782 RepID=A0A165P581_9AGAM|nr:cytochrome P450 [Neolentinus lepideus HHB14362 ss-1]
MELVHWHALVVISVICVAFRQARAILRRHHLPLPPGPKGLPFLGNLLHVSRHFQWLTFEKWHQQYGDIIHVNLMGQPVIVLNSLEVINQLLDRRAAIYSDRTRMVMVNELMGWELNLPTMRYGVLWREYRRNLNEQFRQAAVRRYHPVFLRHTRRLLHNILVEPKHVLQHLSLASAAIILDVTFGLNVVSKDDPFVAMADVAMKGMSTASVPGAFLVETIPILKCIPLWFPGATFRRKALVWKQAHDQLFHEPFEAFKNGTDGANIDSIAEKMLQDIPPDQSYQQRECATKSVCATAYAAGFDTSMISSHFFLLAMAMHPEVQQRAHEEIDAVVGQTRLPDFTDRGSLPYVNAIVKEVLRWQPVLPLSIPHASTEDDIFRGYFIPKGSLVIGNTWSVMHDPIHYPDPEQFKPERFLTDDGKLDPNVQDPMLAAFGYGRRICPGRYFAENALYLIISCMLMSFDVTPPVSENGTPIKLEPVIASGIIVHPVPFECVVKPRSEAAANLIDRSLNEFQE